MTPLLAECVACDIGRCLASTLTGGRCVQCVKLGRQPKAAMPAAPEPLFDMPPAE